MPIQFSSDDDILDIRYDSIFKAIFTKDTANARIALGALISAAIAITVSVETVLQNEPAPEDIHDRQIRFDIHCRTIDGQLINVEMTMYPDQYEPLRIEFFTCKLFTSQDISGSFRKYSDLKPTYHISILAKRNLKDDRSYYHHFQYFDSVEKISLGGRTHIITIELAKADFDANKAVDEMNSMERWSLFMKYSTDRDKREMVNQILKSEEGISMAAETLLTISKDENERTRLLTEYKVILDYQSGLAEAEDIGEQRGMERGIEIGEKRGINVGKIDSAINAIISLNVSVAEAMRVFKIEPQYRDDLISKLKNQGVTAFIE